LKKSLLAISLASLSSVAFSAVLLNETFESIPGAPGAGGYQPLVAATTFSSPGGPTWTVGGDSIDLINAGYNSPAGSTGVDLNGNAAGSITTFISATAGISNFTLTFDYWGNGGAGRTVNWQVGTYAGILTSSASANSSTSLTPNPFSLSWTANAGTTMLVKFTGSENDGASGGTIDNIRLTQDFVAAIPEPGEWAMMLAGLSIVSIIARRRKKE
jgi:Protein of unknown function (DUF642)